MTVWSRLIPLTLLTLWGCEAPDGEVLFETKCAACHGLDAAGVTDLGPDIRGNLQDPVEAIADIILDGVGEMPAVYVKGKEATAIAEYATINLSDDVDRADWNS